MGTQISINRKLTRMFVNILSIVAVLAIAFPAMGDASAQEYDPWFSAFPEGDIVEGWGWPLGAGIHLTIDDPVTSIKPDYFQDGTMTLYDPESGATWVWFEFPDAYDMKPGDVVTMSMLDETMKRTHEVQDLAITGIDPIENQVFGTTKVGLVVTLWSWEDAEGRQIETDGSANWGVDFDDIGFTLEPGYHVRALVKVDGNETAVDWEVPWPPSTFVVNTTDDFDDGNCDEAHCSLREAINTANTRASADTIIFNIPGDPPYSIQPQSPFPDLTDPVVIDGTTQPEFSGSPVIELDGTNAGDWTSGLLIAANDSTVKGLAINRFSDNGIILFGSGNTVEGNYIGTDTTGTSITGSESGPAVGVYIVDALDETCPTYDRGTDKEGFISESDDPLAPWFGASVIFKGFDEDKCGIPETYEDVPLIYRYRLVFEEPTELASIAVTGAAFNGGILRVLDADMEPLGIAYTVGGNSFQTNYVVLDNVEGTVFYIDEFDYSSDWRFRQDIAINGPLPLGNHGNGVLIAGGATNNFVVENLISGNAANGVGIFNQGTTGNTVQDNYIGTDITGQQALGNAAPGVGIGDQAYDNFIIGNLISGNKADGVALFNADTNGNTLQGNNIGTDASGMTAIPNVGVGVWIGEGASDTIIGGTDASVRNVISGNAWGGVSINNLETTGTQVMGNFIGTNENGDDVLPNGGDGVFVSASQSLIGGAEPGAGNLISGNTASGISITESASANVVQGNYIGTDVTGTSVTGPNGPAVGEYTLTVLPETCATYDSDTDFEGFISESKDPLAPWSGTSVHFVGTDECGSPETSGEASLIYRYRLEFADETQLTSIMVAGAAFNGPDNVLRVLDEDMNILGTMNTFGGNSFQTAIITLQDVMGKVFYIDEFDTSTTWRFRQSIVINSPLPLGNLGSGVAISGGASDNQIIGNLISGNRSDAVALYHSGTNGNILRGNYIGTDASGTVALPNTSAGIWIGEGASNTLIGGVGEGEGNVISGNTGDAISINNAETTGTVIQSNFIGTDVSGNLPVPNLSNGIVLVTGTHDNLIGGTEPGAGNVISGNQGDGIFLVDDGTSNNLIQGNFIGTDVTGTVALGNLYRGLFIGGGANNNLISGNVISGNGAAGVRLMDNGTTGNQVQGNFIGTDVTGMNPMGNGYFGIRITDGAANNLIGGLEPGTGNTIAYNAAAGVAMNGEETLENAILANSVFSNAGLGIDLGEDEVTPNDVLDGDAGPNNLQNFPILTNVTRIGDSVRIHGMLTSSPGTVYRLEFFASDTCDPSGYGEGQTFLGYANVTTNRVGIGNFNIILPISLPDESFVAATATDPSGNTSEYSQCFGPTK